MAVRDEDRHLVELNPDAFRIPAAVVALRDKEDRITGEGSICPVLKDGLETALSWLSRWSHLSGYKPRIEWPAECEHPVAKPEIAAAFVSGGVDSLAMLAANHAYYSEGDPRRYGVGIVVVGIQKLRWTDSDDIRTQLDTAGKHLARVSDLMGIELIPVMTNIRTLNPSSRFWQYEFQGAVLAGIGHLFSGQVWRLGIASTWDIPNLDNWGSHPLLDPNYGNHSLQISHEQAHLGRYEKLELIATHPDLLSTINVCNASVAGDRNCGHCEKCIRTMLALEAMGRLESCKAFEQATIRPSDLDSVRITSGGLAGEYRELIEPLKSAGRSDLSTKLSHIVWRERQRRRLAMVKGRLGRHLRRPRRLRSTGAKNES